MLGKIAWLGHSTIKIKDEKIIYIDPWRLKTDEKADIILISHSHPDHLSVDDVNKIQKGDTVIITTPDSAEKLSGDVRVVRPGETVTEHGIRVEAVPSYNLTSPYHPRESSWIGFVIHMGGKNIYYAGDTDFVPEIREIKADIAIVPVSGYAAMSAEDAAEAVNAMKPTCAIPVHFGAIIGSMKDAIRFKDLSSVPVEIKPVVES